MNQNILDLVEQTAIAAEAQNTHTRAEALTKLGQLGKKIALSAVPVAALILGGSYRAMAASRDAVTDALNFALNLEYLENAFYSQGLASGVVASSDRSLIQSISGHESAHVAYLQNAIATLGGTPGNSPTFDFTAGGMYSPFTVYSQFLALAQAFEDTGVRAYKGQVATIMANNDILTAAMQIQATESRHAAAIRSVRRSAGYDTAKNWITTNNRGSLPIALQAVYNGEDNTSQANLSFTTAGINYVTEAFDEPLSQADVLSIVNAFVV